MIRKFRKGQKVLVDFADSDPTCAYTGIGTFDHYLGQDGDGMWKEFQDIEPHCVVMLPCGQHGSCFPVRCVSNVERPG